jgi:hypothetical protein
MATDQLRDYSRQVTRMQGDMDRTINKVDKAIRRFKKEAIRIIHEEKLQDYNMNEERYNRENEVVLRHENDKWIVYVTDERASKITTSQDTYSNEEEAFNVDLKQSLIKIKKNGKAIFIMYSIVIRSHIG